MKKIILLASALMLICGSMVFAGGGRDSGSSDSDITIQFLANEAPLLPREFWQTVADRYHAENPNVTVEIIYQPSSNILVTEYAKTLLATGQFPDVTVMATPSDFVPSGALLELEEKDVDMIAPDYIHKINGEIYVVPFKIQVGGVWYNKDMFAEYGFDVPKNWEEFVAICEGFLAEGIAPNVMGLKDAWPTIVPMATIQATETLKADQNWPVKRMNGETTFAENKDFVEGIEKHALLMNKYNVADKSSMTYAQNIEAFFNEKSPMFIMGSWIQGFEVSTEHDFEVGFFPIPSDDGEMIMPVWVNEGLSISSRTKHPEVCKDFVRFFLEDETWAAQWLASEQYFSPLKDPIVYDASRLNGEVAKIIETCKSIPNFYDQVGDNAWFPGGSNLLSRMALEVAAGEDIDVAIANLDREFDRLVENYAE